MPRRPGRDRRPGRQPRRRVRAHPAATAPESVDAGASLAQRAEERCVCGHRHPEHLIEGPCRGCVECLADEASEHALVPCPCPRFSRRDAPSAAEAL
jgi:hypothetical protein